MPRSAQPSPLPRPSPLTSHLGYWLRYVSNHVTHAFARKLDEQDVTVAEWALLRELHDLERIAPSQLADRMGLTRGAITRLADRLIAKALVAREANPDDARAQILAITAAGRAVIPRLSALADLNDAEFFGHLNPKDRKHLEQLLKTIIERRGLTAIPID